MSRDPGDDRGDPIGGATPGDPLGAGPSERWPMLSGADPEGDRMTIQISCPWAACSCAHAECVAGWLDTDGSTAPCPACRPEVAGHLRNVNIPIARSRATLPALSRPSREAAKGLGESW